MPARARRRPREYGGRYLFTVEGNQRNLRQGAGRLAVSRARQRRRQTAQLTAAGVRPLRGRRSMSSTIN